MARLTSGRGRRTAAALATTSLVVAGLGFTSAPATATPAGDRAVNASATWLTSQLTDGLVHNDEYDYDDLGLSADFALALKAVGGHDATVTQIADAVAPVVTTWYDSFGTIYTGSAAKAAVLAQTAGQDATSFGGQNLVTVVEDRTATAAPITGRVQNEGELTFPDNLPTDSLNVISQSFAARALTTAGSARAGDVSSFLLEQQCAEGFFRATMNPDKEAAEQGCVSGDEGSVDTTALTAINILDTTNASPAATSAAASAIDWLKTQQAADGSFSAGATEGYNANSTGIAGWALAKAGETAAATKAAGWLRAVQVADIAPCVTTLATENGAVAYKPTILASIRTAGSIKVGQRDQFRRATSQALPALANVPAGTGPLAISAPATAVEKSTVTVTVAGLGAGEAGCVSFGSVAKPVTGTGSDVTVTFDLPAGAVANTFTLTTLAGSQTAVTNSTLAPVVTPTPTPTPTPVPTPTPTPTPGIGKLVVKKNVTVKGNKFTLAVACNEPVDCEGKIVIRTTKKVKVGQAKKAHKVKVTRTVFYTVSANERSKTSLTINKATRKLLAEGRVKVKAVQSAAGADTAITKFWLRNK